MERPCRSSSEGPFIRRLTVDEDGDVHLPASCRRCGHVEPSRQPEALAITRVRLEVDARLPWALDAHHQDGAQVVGAHALTTP